MQNSLKTPASNPHARISNQHGVVRTVCVPQDGPQELALKQLDMQCTCCQLLVANILDSY